MCVKEGSEGNIQQHDYKRQVPPENVIGFQVPERQVDQGKLGNDSQRVQNIELVVTQVK